jgi:hypothetical protein
MNNKKISHLHMTQTGKNYYKQVGPIPYIINLLEKTF